VIGAHSGLFDDVTGSMKRLHGVADLMHSSRTVSHHLVSFDAKKKLWRPCRKARALGL